MRSKLLYLLPLAGGGMIGQQFIENTSVPLQAYHKLIG